MRKPLFLEMCVLTVYATVWAVIETLTSGTVYTQYELFLHSRL